MKDDHELEACQHHKEEDVEAAGWLIWAVVIVCAVAAMAKAAGL